MLLAIDVGNTHMTVGVFDGEKIIHHWRFSTRGEKTEDELGCMILNLLERGRLTVQDIDGIVVGSVVPIVTEMLLTMGPKYFKKKPLVINSHIDSVLTMSFDHPQEVGADRIADSLAAYRLYGGPVIVVDFGTATTFDYVTADGEYSGGSIAPGIGISVDALFARAAKLSTVEYVQPPAVIGKNTVHSVQSGLYYGFAGQVDYIIEKMIGEIGRNDVTVVATGGYGGLVERESKYIQKVEPFLTLYGLKMLYEENI